MVREDLAEENLRMRKLRLIVDTTTMAIRAHPLTKREAEGLVASLRIRVLGLFPGKEAEFDLIYAPRFRRIIEDRFGSGHRVAEPDTATPERDPSSGPR